MAKWYLVKGSSCNGFGERENGLFWKRFGKDMESQDFRDHSKRRKINRI